MAVVVLPTGIGQKASSESLSVVIASDQTVPTSGGAGSSGSVMSLAAGTNVAGGVRDAGPDSSVGTLQTPYHQDFSGSGFVTPAPTTGMKWVITDIFMFATSACEVRLEEETTGTDLFGPVPLAANTGGQFVPRSKLKLATANKRVMGVSSTADHVTIQVGGYSEA